MNRQLTMTFNRRGVRFVVDLLDDEAPLTCRAVWDSLPRTGQAYHAKYARNELYAFVEPLVADPGPENTTVTPFTGDLCYFSFTSTALANPGYSYAAETQTVSTTRIVDLAVFYGRNNLLINADQGFVPGNVFGHVTGDLQLLADLGQDIWQNGFAGESITFERIGD